MLLCPWNSSGKNTEVGCHSVLQGIFLTQGSNLGLLQCRQILYHLSRQGSPWHSLCQQIWKTQQEPQDWNPLTPILKKGSTKEWLTIQTIALISHASKVMLKTLHARLQHYANQELPDVQAGFRKGRGAKDQIQWIIGKAREFQKNISVSLTSLKPLTMEIMTNCGKFLERWEYQTISPVS